MKRRTKLDMKWMKEDVSEWLLKSNNDPHEAWDEYCKHLIMNNHLRSHYIRGKEDFVKVSKEIVIEIEKQRLEKEHKETAKQNKERVMDELKGLSPEEGWGLWKENKGKLNDNEKSILVDLVNMITHQEYWIEEKHIRLYSKLELQPA